MFGKVETRLNFYSWVALMCAAFLLGNHLLNNAVGVVVVPTLVFLMVVRVACFHVREPSLLRRLVGRYGLVVSPNNLFALGGFLFAGAVFDPVMIHLEQFGLLTQLFTLLFIELTIAFFVNRGNNGRWLYPFFPEGKDCRSTCEYARPSYLERNSTKETIEASPALSKFFMAHAVFAMFVLMSCYLYFDNEFLNTLRYALLLGMLEALVLLSLYLFISRTELILNTYRPGRKTQT